MVYQESVKENHDYINGLIMIALIIICPPIGIILALFCLYKGYNNWKINVFCISYAMAVFAYCYIPTVDSDLVRYLNNPVPVSLLSGDRKPQIRFLGNHPSGSGNLYHKSFRM